MRGTSYKLEQEKFGRSDRKKSVQCEGGRALEQGPGRLWNLHPWRCVELGWTLALSNLI